MSRVFVIEPPTVNIEPAEAWGEVIVLFPEGSGMNPLDANVYAGRVIEKLEEEEFSPKNDMLLIVGPLIALTVCAGAIVSRFKTIRGLLYNPVKNEYVLRTIGRWQYVEKFKRNPA